MKYSFVLVCIDVFVFIFDLVLSNLCHVIDTQDSESDSETQSEESRDSNYDSETTDSYSDDDYEIDEKIRKRPKKGNTTEY